MGTETESRIETSLDPAKDLAEKFKREGHLDSLRKAILSQVLEDDINLEELIKNRVRDLVRDNVDQDQSLIFKNRGTATALLEGKLFKDSFNSLNTSQFNVEKLLEDSLHDKDLKQKIRAILEEEKGEP